ncbi:MAG: hypothetical protein AB7O80_13445 [Acetobacteraceae bacterium]
MKISDRFADHALLGTFFWLILGFAFAFANGLASPDIVIEADRVIEQAKKFLTGTDSLQTPLIATLGIAALATVFTTGVVLDLFGYSYFRMIEAGIFRAHIRENEQWLDPIAARYGPYLEADWANLKRWASGSNCMWDIKSLWRTRKSYTRVQSFLMSYILLAHGVASMETQSAQVSLWHAGRMISTTLLIGSGLMGLYFIWQSLQGTGGQSLRWAPLIVQIVLFIGAIIVTRIAYSRVCSTLFAVTYIVAHTQPVSGDDVDGKC